MLTRLACVSIAAAALPLVGCSEAPAATATATKVEMGQWVECNGVVGTIEAADGAGYVVQVWQPALRQVTCAADQIRIVPEPGTQAPAPAAPTAPVEPPVIAAAPVQPAPQPVAAEKPATGGKVADGSYTCGKIVGGGGEYRTFGTFNLRNGQVTGSPFPDGWVVLSVATSAAKGDRGEPIVEIRYRTSSGNTDLLDCTRD